MPAVNRGTRQRKRTTDALREYLREQARRTEKAPPTVFVGRKSVIDSVMDFQRYWKPNEVYSDTYVISGAPGAGKTSLAGELARRWEKRKGATSIVRPSVPKTDEDVQNICRQIAMALGALKPGEERTTKSKGRKGGGDVKIVRGEVSRGISITPPRVTGVQAIPDLPGFNRKKAEERRVAVLIDEIQNIEPGTPAAALVDDLHTQQTLPILLICFGLADGKAKLSEAKNTRFVEDHIHRIGPLTFDEAVECVTRNIKKAKDEYKLPASEGAIELWAKKLARKSDQWPRHLHCYLTSTWKTLVEMAEPNLDAASLKAALAQGKDMRTAYYERQIGESGVNISIIRALTRALSEATQARGLHKDDVLAVISRSIADLDQDRRQEHLDDFPLATHCLMQLLHNGVVTHDAGNFYSIAIPTLGGHVGRTGNSGGL